MKFLFAAPKWKFCGFSVYISFQKEETQQAVLGLAMVFGLSSNIYKQKDRVADLGGTRIILFGRFGIFGAFGGVLVYLVILGQSIPPHYHHKKG